MIDYFTSQNIGSGGTIQISAPPLLIGNQSAGGGMNINLNLGPTTAEQTNAAYNFLGQQYTNNQGFMAGAIMTNNAFVGSNAQQATQLFSAINTSNTSQMQQIIANQQIIAAAANNGGGGGGGILGFFGF